MLAGSGTVTVSNLLVALKKTVGVVIPSTVSVAVLKNESVTITAANGPKLIVGLVEPLMLVTVRNAGPPPTLNKDFVADGPSAIN